MYCIPMINIMLFSKNHKREPPDTQLSIVKINNWNCLKVYSYYKQAMVFIQQMKPNLILS